MSRSNPQQEKVHTLIFLAVLVVGVFVRVWRFGSVPGGLNQDEAFAGYEAWSLLNYGTDSAGYRFPVYLTAWGSGMNVLNSYLMIPFIALFGLEVWVIRLPQLIVACLTLPAVYGIARRILDQRLALMTMFLLAVCPWHIMLARWGLESNLAPGFLMFGLYFFIRGLDDERFLILSAAMYGLSLYCYATIWPFVPLIILLQCIHAVRIGRLRLSACSVISLLILGLLALPLILFLAVNYGLIGELCLPFISVPKLLYMRSDEISFSRFFENLSNGLRMLLAQSDGLKWNSAGIFGQLYPFSIVFELIGLGFCISRYIRSLKAHSFSGEVFILIQLFAAFLLMGLISVNVNRVNIIFIPRVMLAAYGVRSIEELSMRAAAPLICTVYAVFFLLFASYYFGEYNSQISFRFGDGIGEAVSAALEISDRIYVSDDILYPVILFYSETPTDEFRDSVVYYSYPAAYLRARSFTRFEFTGLDGELHRDGVYILSQYDDRTSFIEAGFTVTEYGFAALAYP